MFAVRQRGAGSSVNWQAYVCLHWNRDTYDSWSLSLYVANGWDLLSRRWPRPEECAVCALNFVGTLHATDTVLGVQLEAAVDVAVRAMLDRSKHEDRCVLSLSCDACRAGAATDAACFTPHAQHRRDKWPPPFIAPDPVGNARRMPRTRPQPSALCDCVFNPCQRVETMGLDHSQAVPRASWRGSLLSACSLHQPSPCPCCRCAVRLPCLVCRARSAHGRFQVTCFCNQRSTHPSLNALNAHRCLRLHLSGTCRRTVAPPRPSAAAQPPVPRGLAHLTLSAHRTIRTASHRRPSGMHRLPPTSHLQRPHAEHATPHCDLGRCTPGPPEEHLRVPMWLHGPRRPPGRLSLCPVDF